MIAKMTRTDFKLALLQWVILPVFLLRALIPAGFMPDFKADHSATMTICSGYEAKTVSMPQDGEHQKQKGDHLPCGFSFASSGPMAQGSTITSSEQITLAITQRSDVVLAARLSRGYRSQAPPIV